MSVKNGQFNCPMCEKNAEILMFTSKASICKECYDYCNAPYVSVEQQNYELYVKRFGEEHPETIRLGSLLGFLSLCIIIMPLLTLMEVA